MVDILTAIVVLAALIYFDVLILVAYFKWTALTRKNAAWPWERIFWQEAMTSLCTGCRWPLITYRWLLKRIK